VFRRRWRRRPCPEPMPCACVGRRPATAGAGSAARRLQRTSLFRKIGKHPGDDYRTSLSFDSKSVSNELILERRSSAMTTPPSTGTAPSAYPSRGRSPGRYDKRP
jgi:hypothetical protein